MGQERETRGDEEEEEEEKEGDEGEEEEEQEEEEEKEEEAGKAEHEQKEQQEKQEEGGRAVPCSTMENTCRNQRNPLARGRFWSAAPLRTECGRVRPARSYPRPAGERF